MTNPGSRVRIKSLLDQTAGKPLSLGILSPKMEHKNIVDQNNSFHTQSQGGKGNVKAIRFQDAHVVSEVTPTRNNQKLHTVPDQPSSPSAIVYPY